ncbi:hypothetical protein A2U01_0090110, partial [Trifolium medium]|nr:hypothetical protein [Trifolium medium]
TTLGTDSPVGSGVRDQGTGDSPQLSGVQGSFSIRSPSEGPRRAVVIRESEGSFPIPFRGKRTKSCPPGVNRSVISGPWSLD